MSTLPEASVVCLEALLGAHSPWYFGFGLDAPHTPEGASCSRVRGDWSCYCRRIPQTAPKCLFLFEKILLLNPAAPYKEGPVLSHSPPLQLDRGLSGSGPDKPNSRLSLAGAHSLHGLTTSSLFPSMQLQAARSLSVLLKPCLVGEEAINLALSQASRCRPGTAVSLVPAMVPGTFLS